MEHNTAGLEHDRPGMEHTAGMDQGPEKSAPAVQDPWAAVERLYGWLDGRSTLPADQERLLRLLKLTEETGEVAAAVIGATGQNPRKGVTHSWGDVEAELCDVIVTAMVALRTLTPEAARVFAGHLRRVDERTRI